jgi:hypothetical protein
VSIKKYAYNIYAKKYGKKSKRLGKQSIKRGGNKHENGWDCKNNTQCKSNYYNKTTKKCDTEGVNTTNLDSILLEFMNKP